MHRAKPGHRGARVNSRLLVSLWLSIAALPAAAQSAEETPPILPASSPVSQPTGETPADEPPPLFSASSVTDLFANVNGGLARGVVAMEKCPASAPMRQIEGAG